MRVLTSLEVSSVSGAGVTVSPVINLNFNFFLALFSIFKKKTTTVTPPATTPGEIG
jgi:hypothetical protein